MDLQSKKNYDQLDFKKSNKLKKKKIKQYINSIQQTTVKTVFQIRQQKQKTLKFCKNKK